MSAMLFVDTNVLLYQIDRADPRKHKIARHWREWLWATRRGRLSFQVLQEFYSTFLGNGQRRRSRRGPKSRIF